MALQDAEGTLGAAAQQQQQHSDALQLARRELAERISTTQSSTGDCQELQQRLEQLRGACADMQGRLQRTTQEGDRVSQQAAHARQQQRTLGSAQGERSEWALVDERGDDRLTHQGDTIVPGAGVAWKHAHRSAMGEWATARRDLLMNPFIHTD